MAHGIMGFIENFKYKYSYNTKNIMIKNEVVVSHIKDPHFQNHFNDTEIWKNSYHLEDFTPEIRATKSVWYSYTVKFDGTRPMQVTKFTQI